MADIGRDTLADLDTVNHKRGDSLSFDVLWIDDDTDRDLSALTATSQVRDTAGTLIGTLTCSVDDSPGRVTVTVTATAAEAAAWRTGHHRLDVELTLGAEVWSTDTIEFVVLDDITRA